MNFISDFFKWFVDTTVKIWHKISIFCLVIFLIWCVDNIMGFSTFRYARSKAETVKVLQEASNVDSISPIIRNRLRKEQMAVLEKQSLTDRISNFFSSPKLPSKANTLGSWESIKQFGILWYILICLVPPLVLIPAAIADKETKTFRKVIIMLIVELAILIVSIILSLINMWAHLWVIGLTPVICFLVLMLFYAIFIADHNE